MRRQYSNSSRELRELHQSIIGVIRVIGG